MITDIQRKWVEQLIKGTITKSDNPRKYSAYMKRIQKRIDEMMTNLLWLADNAPEILKNEEEEYDNIALERHQRLKTLLRICVKINPLTEDPTIFKIIGTFLPSNFEIGIFRKTTFPPEPMVVFKCNNCNVEFEPSEIKEGNCPNCKSSNYSPMKDN